jgi:hypothetical protein
MKSHSPSHAKGADYRVSKETTGAKHSTRKETTGTKYRVSKETTGAKDPGRKETTGTKYRVSKETTGAKHPNRKKTTGTKYIHPKDATGAEYRALKDILMQTNIAGPASSSPYIGLVIDKTKDKNFLHSIDENFGLPIGCPENFTITAQQKMVDGKVIPYAVIINIYFKINEVEMVKEIKPELEKQILDNERGFLGIKKYNITEDAGVYEIDIKKMPKLALRPANKNTFALARIKSPLVLTPTIESNDTTVRVGSSFIIKGQVGSGFYKFSPGLKVRIAQKILGDYIVSGLDPDSFTFKFGVHDITSAKTGISANICFDLYNAEINDNGNEQKNQNPEWQELLQQSLIAYFTFNDRRLTNNGTGEYTINILPDTYSNMNNLNLANGSNDSYILANFSFSMIDGRVRGLADKQSGGHGLQLS